MNFPHHVVESANPGEDIKDERGANEERWPLFSRKKDPNKWIFLNDVA